MKGVFNLQEKLYSENSTADTTIQGSQNCNIQKNHTHVKQVGHTSEFPFGIY